MDLQLPLVPKPMMKAGSLRIILTSLRLRESKVAGDPRARASSLNKMIRTDQLAPCNRRQTPRSLRGCNSRPSVYRTCTKWHALQGRKLSCSRDKLKQRRYTWFCLYALETLFASPVPMYAQVLGMLSVRFDSNCQHAVHSPYSLFHSSNSSSRCPFNLENLFPNTLPHLQHFKSRSM